MIQIVNIRGQFLSKAVYEVYAPCMYEPTWEKFCGKAEKFFQNDHIVLLGAVEDNAVLGVIVLELHGGAAEIIGIAVLASHRQRGIGRQMVQFTMGLPNIRQLYAETDDDAVAFYRSCGFRIDAHTETFPDGEVIRYQCALQAQK